MSTLSLRLPQSIHRHIKEIAQKEGVSINQFISSAVSEKISCCANGLAGCLADPRSWMRFGETITRSLNAVWMFRWSAFGKNWTAFTSIS